jgi:hypothetical protein
VLNYQICKNCIALSKTGNAGQDTFNNNFDAPITNEDRFIRQCSLKNVILFVFCLTPTAV